MRASRSTQLVRRRSIARPLFWRTRRLLRQLRSIRGLTPPARLWPSTFNLQPSTAAQRQGGAVIIVVISLLTSLMLLGIFQFRWIGQELISADSAANDNPIRINADPIFDAALRQVIVSVPDDKPLSVLNANDNRMTGAFGSENVSLWSLLAHEIGPVHATGQPLDMQLLNGKGISLMNATGPGAFNIDLDGDGVVDQTAANFRLNFSAMSGAAVQISSLLSSFATNPLATIQPDAGYTYPDINSLFLAMDYVDPVTGVRVTKPSFTLPRYFADPTNPAPDQSLRVHITGHTHANRSYLPGPVSAVSGDRSRVIPQYVLPATQWGAYQGSSTYALDKDLNGDGVDDAIDMDLDYPLMDLAGGRQVVPIFQFKIIDLDGLINLNTAGNQAQVTFLSNRSILTGTPQVSPADIYATNTWSHDSNLGLSRSEVNPLYALQANPQSTNYVDAVDLDWATAPLRAWVADRSGASPVGPASSTITRLKAANIELARLLYGTPDFFSDSLEYAGLSQLAGRYGDGTINPIRNFLGSASLTNGIIPSPGQIAQPPTYTFTTDDDVYDYTLSSLPAGSHQVTSQRGPGGPAYADTRAFTKLPTVPIAPFVHPLDYAGIGDLASTTGSSYRKSTINPGDLLGERVSGYTNTNSPVRWPQYPQSGSGYSLWENQGLSTSTVLNGSDTYTNLGYRTLRDAANLQAGTAQTFMANLPNEMNQYGTLGPQGNDSLFSFGEIAALQLSDSDWNRLGSASQLRKLMPLNFEYNKQASRIRQHFTTASWDRTEVSFAPFNHATNRVWEFSNPVDLSSIIGTPSTHLAFPPQFGSVTPSRHDIGTPITADDPFRPEVRRLLTAFSPDNPITFTAATPSNAVDQLRKAFPRQKLNINRILSDDTLYGGQGAFDTMGNPVYRELVPHVVDRGQFSTADITTFDLTTGNYEMIYNNRDTLSAPAAPHAIRRFNDISTNHLVQEWWARYDRQRLARDIYVMLYTLAGPDTVNVTTGALPATVSKEMAQFAVNYVDALDRDDVITQFQYDDNLSDGWGTAGSVVFGVEAQQLAFSEVLLITTQDETTDFMNTLHKDDDGPHRFLYVELRNVSPLSVDLYDQSWRLVRLNVDQITQEAAVRFHERVIAPTDRKQIGSGENFLVACHDGSVRNAANTVVGSEFFANSDDGTAGLEGIVPRGITTNLTDNNGVTLDDIDLDINPYDDGLPTIDSYYLTVDMAFADGTSLVDHTNTPFADNTLFYLSLQRRQNTHAKGVGESTWIEVDRFEVNPSKGKFDADDNATSIATQLGNVKSSERYLPLNDRVADNPTATGTQIHSLYRQGNTTTKHHANDVLADAITAGTVNLPGPVDSATEVKLWQPHFDRDFSSAIELLSVPIYGNWRAVGPSLAIPQDPQERGVIRSLVQRSGSGEYGVSGYRAAMRRFLFPNTTEFPASHPYLLDTTLTNTENRWYRLFNFVDIPDSADDLVETQLQYQRRTPGKINLNTLRQEAVLAGLVDDDVHFNGITANAEQPTTDKLDPGRNWMTELRKARDVDIALGTYLPGSPLSKPFRPMGWLDPTTPNESVESSLIRQDASSTDLGLFEARPTSDVGVEAIDHHTRNRLLAKVSNNSTVRSHVYGIWVGFDLHEAHQNGSQVQIGGKATDLPAYRMFCVVDMSRLEEAYDPVSKTYDFRKFIVHRQVLP